MKDLRVNSNGDLILSKNDLQLVRDKDLTAQKIKMILGTNKGEWSLNEDEGINFGVMLVKNPNEDEILDTVLDGLRQIDETFRITEYSFETVKRHLMLNFRAVSDNGEEVSLVVGEASGTNLIVCAADAETVLRAGNAIEAACICDTDGIIIDCDI